MNHSCTIPLSSLRGLASANGVFNFPVSETKVVQKATLIAVERAEKAAMKAEKAEKTAIKAMERAEKAEKAAIKAMERAEKAEIKAEKDAEKVAIKAKNDALKAEKAALNEEMKTLKEVISANLSPTEEKTVKVRAHTRRAPVKKTLKKTIADVPSPKADLTSVSVEQTPTTLITERKFLITCPNLEVQYREPGGWSCNFSDKENNIVFAFGSRPRSNVIIMNSFKRNAGGWGPEDRHPLSRFDCSPGNQILFTLTKDGFIVSANGTSHFYPHRFADVNILDIIPDMASLNEKNRGDRVIGVEF